MFAAPAATRSFLSGPSVVDPDCHERALRAVQDQICAAIEQADAEAVKQAHFDAMLALLGRTPFPESFFTFLIETVFSPPCLELTSSWYLLALLQDSWRSLTPSQRERLLLAIRAHYGAFRDWMAWFVISELLGERYANRAAFRVLNELRDVEDAHARSFVAHGYEHLVRDSENEHLARNALEMLLGMADDPSPRVRYEVAVSLARIGWRDEDAE